MVDTDVGQKHSDPMQHTFNSVYQPQSAQVIRNNNDAFSTPLGYNNNSQGPAPSDDRDSSQINPFSIASRVSDLPYKEQITAEGFFKNPTAVQVKATSNVLNLKKM